MPVIPNTAILLEQQMYLCHKCGGTLQKSDDKRLYDCGCISSYIREWQEPSKAPVDEQIQHQTATIAWLRQRNAEGDDQRIKECEKQIEILKGPPL